MGLRELDSKYKIISEELIEDRIEYCESLIHRIRYTHRDEYVNTGHARMLLETVGSALDEIEMLRKEYKKQKVTISVQ